MTKGIIYYTDNRIENELIYSVVQEQLLRSGLPITSVSLKPISFGENTALDLTPGFVALTKQITTALGKSRAKYVFFCEHDVLYPASHFDFTPKRNDIFYYNEHVWRWKYPANLAITYDRLFSLSSLCVEREFALAHYQKRIETLKKLGLDNDKSRDPRWARKWGYEPGTKKRRRGGFSDDNFETWRSEYPIIDIRHGRTHTPPKVTLDSFIHPPSNWTETTLEKIPGWDIRKLFNLTEI